jgi:hypothetical protein
MRVEILYVTTEFMVFCISLFLRLLYFILFFLLSLLLPLFFSVWPCVHLLPPSCPVQHCRRHRKTQFVRKRASRSPYRWQLSRCKCAGLCPTTNLIYAVFYQCVAPSDVNNNERGTVLCTYYDRTKTNRLHLIASSLIISLLRLFSFL